MLKQTILLISCLMVLAGCGGKSHESYTRNSNTTYTDQPPIYYEYPSAPKTTPPVQYNPYAAPPAPLSPQPVPVYPQESTPGISPAFQYPNEDERSEPSNYQSWRNYVAPQPEQEAQPPSFINTQTGDSYLRLGNDENSWYVGPKGDTIMPFGNWKVDQKGNTYMPFGNGYIDSNGTYLAPTN